MIVLKIGFIKIFGFALRPKHDISREGFALQRNLQDRLNTLYSKSWTRWIDSVQAFIYATRNPIYTNERGFFFNFLYTHSKQRGHWIVRLFTRVMLIFLIQQLHQPWHTTKSVVSLEMFMAFYSTDSPKTLYRHLMKIFRQQTLPTIILSSEM